MQPVERAFRKNYKTFFLSPEFLVAFNLRQKLSKLQNFDFFHGRSSSEEKGNSIHINVRYTQALASGSRKSDYPSCQKC